MICEFCTLATGRIEIETDYFYVIRDGYPIIKGHSLIIPKRHTASFFELNLDENQHLPSVLLQAKQDLDARFQPQAYNIGVNDGECAGQTIMHLHIHLIPRYNGDQKNPKGGIRWIFPEKASYWNG